MTFPTPAVGSKVTCVTKWPTFAVNGNIITDCVEFNQYHGKVLDSKDHDEANTFRLTGNKPRFLGDQASSLRVISLERVITLVVDGKNIQPIKGKLKPVKDSFQYTEIASSSGDKTYTIKIKNHKAIHCPCQGFYFRRHCSHIKKANKQLTL